MFEAVKNDVLVPVAVLVTVGVPEGVVGVREKEVDAEREEEALCPGAEAEGGGLTGGAGDMLEEGVFDADLFGVLVGVLLSDLKIGVREAEGVIVWVIVGLSVAEKVGCLLKLGEGVVVAVIVLVLDGEAILAINSDKYNQ